MGLGPGPRPWKRVGVAVVTREFRADIADQVLRGQDCRWTPASAAATSPYSTRRRRPPQEILAQGLTFGAAGQDRAALVLIDDARTAADAALPGGRFEAVAGLADDVAPAVFGQGKRQVED